MMSNQPNPDERWDSAAEKEASQDSAEPRQRRQDAFANAAAEHQRESEVQREGGMETTEEMERRIAQGSKGSSTGQSTRPPH